MREKKKCLLQPNNYSLKLQPEIAPSGTVRFWIFQPCIALQLTEGLSVEIISSFSPFHLFLNSIGCCLKVFELPKGFWTASPSYVSPRHSFHWPEVIDILKLNIYLLDPWLTEIWTDSGRGKGSNKPTLALFRVEVIWISVDLRYGHQELLFWLSCIELIYWIRQVSGLFPVGICHHHSAIIVLIGSVESSWHRMVPS